MSTFFTNNKIGLALILGFILIFNLTGCIKTTGGVVSNEDVLLNTDKFITYLFANELEEAGKLALGIVKFNIVSNKADFELEGSFNIEKIKSELEFVSDDLAVVNSTVSYMDNIRSEYNTIFYKIRLLKEDNEWKIYHLDETDPIFNNGENIKKIDMTELNEENLKKIFVEYIESLSSGNYQESSKYLIGRAKKMHNKANPALSGLDLVNKIKDLETKLIYGEEDNNIVIRFDYKNNDRPISVLVYFYLTDQGWRIYNVNQI